METDLDFKNLKANLISTLSAMSHNIDNIKLNSKKYLLIKTIVQKSMLVHILKSNYIPVDYEHLNHAKICGFEIIDLSDGIVVSFQDEAKDEENDEENTVTIKEACIEHLDALDEDEELIFWNMLEHYNYGSYSDEEFKLKQKDIHDLIKKWQKRRWKD